MSKLVEMFRKQGGMNLIKDYWRAGVLGYACSQILVTGPSRKSLEILRLGVEMKIYKKIYKRYSSALAHCANGYSEEAFPTSKSNKVWVSWMQGMENAFWVIIDFGDAVVHVFLKEYREFYRLEDLWADAPRKTYTD